MRYSQHARTLSVGLSRLLLANHEQYPYRIGVPESTGLIVYDASSDPTDPRRIGFLPVDGLGVHRIWWTGGRYAYASARERGITRVEHGHRCQAHQ